MCSPPATLAAGFALVLETTNRKQAGLIVVVPVGVVEVVDHAPVVGAATIELAGTPPKAVVADKAETAT